MTIDVIILILLCVSLVLHVFHVFPSGVSITSLQFVGFAATIPVVISAGKALWKRKISVDLLASIALVVSFMQKEWVSVAFINLMITSARIFGVYTETRARETIKKLLKFRPEKVKLKVHGTIIEKHLSEVRVGDTAVIEAGERIAVDGVVIMGTAAVDQSSLTGESMPVPKKEGDKVFSATLNTSGSLLVNVTHVGKDTTFEKILALVENAQEGKPGIRTTAEKFSAWYIAIIFIGAILVWIITGNMTLVLSVLLVTCADDIAVAIPLAFWAAIAYAAKRGIIIKGGNFLELLPQIKTMIVDKTGTVTLGKIKVQSIVPFGKVTDEKILYFAGVAGSVSDHPIDKAITGAAKEKSIVLDAPEEVHEYPGKGIIVSLKRKRILLGNFDFCREQKVRLDEKQTHIFQENEEKGYTTIILAVSGKGIGCIVLSDEVRPKIKETIRRLKHAGIQSVVMLTGDNEYVAKRISTELGITSFHANLLPEDKVKIIKTYTEQKEKVLMVGDGVNDAAALTAADVGIAMGAIGTDAAIEAADIALMHDEFSRIAETVEIGRFTMRITREDFFMWGIVNAIGLTLVFAGVLHPAGAAAFNFVTDFFPILNSFRVFRMKSHVSE